MLGPRLIDLYCERTAPGFWDEPVNAVSNASFPLAAAWTLPVALRRGKRDPLELILIAIGGSIGIGSFLFHTFASLAAELADVIPIWSFVALYVIAVIWRTTGQDVIRTFRIAAIAAVVTCIGIPHAPCSQRHPQSGQPRCPLYERTTHGRQCDSHPRLHSGYQDQQRNAG